MNAGQSHMEQASEVLNSIRRINRNDSKNLLSNYGSIESIVTAPTFDDFLNIEGIGQSKIDSLIYCFRGKFDATKK